MPERSTWDNLSCACVFKCTAASFWRFKLHKAPARILDNYHPADTLHHSWMSFAARRKSLVCWNAKTLAIKKEEDHVRIPAQTTPASHNCPLCLSTSSAPSADFQMTIIMIFTPLASLGCAEVIYCCNSLVLVWIFFYFVQEIESRAQVAGRFRATRQGCSAAEKEPQWRNSVAALRFQIMQQKNWILHLHHAFVGHLQLQRCYNPLLTAAWLASRAKLNKELQSYLLFRHLHVISS